MCILHFYLIKLYNLRIIENVHLTLHILRAEIVLVLLVY